MIVDMTIGTMALKRLEQDALQVGIKTILANISSINTRSIDFHKKNGFVECGRFQKIITKKGNTPGYCLDAEIAFIVLNSKTLL